MKKRSSHAAARVSRLTLLAAFLCAAAVSSGQTASRKPLREVHNEKYDNPPISVFVRRLETSARMVSRFGPYTSYQVNVDPSGNNILGDAANEPSICVDPTNSSRMAIGWRQFDSISSNFRQAGWGHTTDGGATWTFPGVLQPGVFRSDPVLNSDDAGHFYYLSLLFSLFVDLWRSPDSGESWTALAPATGGDKQWFTIDHTNSSGHGFQYQCWDTFNNYNGRQFSRSTDGGVTWQNPIVIPNDLSLGTLDVDTNGNLFVAGVDEITGRIWCTRSTNAKNISAKPSFDQNTPVNLGGDIVGGQSINPGGLVGQVELAVDRSETSTNNSIYVLASVQPTGFFTGSDVVFARSGNGGQSFTSPTRINDDPVNHDKWHWFGALSVAPNGRIDSVWLDTRNAANDTDSQLFYSFSNDGGDTWSPNVQVSNSFNPFLGYPNQNKMGDYITVVSDNSAANVAYSATFNGEEDIYYVRIPPSDCDPIIEGFDDFTLPDWVINNESQPPGTTSWFQGDNTIFAAQAGSAPSYIAADRNNAGGAGTISDWLLTPVVTLRNDGTLTFYTRTVDNPTHADRLQVRMSVNGDSTNVGASATDVGDFTVLLLDVNQSYALNGYPTTWTQYSVTLSGLAGPTTGRLAFRYFVENGGNGAGSANSDYIGIDTVQYNCLSAPVVSAVATPTISPGGGTFKKKVTVTLSCATQGATIHYTTDGSDPTTASPVFAGATGNKKKTKGILIKGKGLHTLKAMAAASGHTNSAIAIATFTIN